MDNTLADTYIFKIITTSYIWLSMWLEMGHSNNYRCSVIGRVSCIVISGLLGTNIPKVVLSLLLVENQTSCFVTGRKISFSLTVN